MVDAYVDGRYTATVGGADVGPCEADLLNA